jgi:tetratricopeptide (TPR) repeat protein
MAASLVVLAGLVLSLAGCGQVSKLKATKAFKEANHYYRAAEYRRAAEFYEEAIAHDPAMTTAYFYLANSYDNLFRPARRGEPENDRYLDLAIENYRKAAELEQDQGMKTLALQYLVQAYGPERLDDPTRAEPLVQQMIRLDPGDTDNYYMLARIYEDAGQYEEAEQILLQAKQMRPNDPTVYQQLAGFYNRQEDFEKTMDALGERAQREPTNPEAFYTMAAYYEEKARRDFRLNDNDRRDIIERGLNAVDRALELNEFYVDALVNKNLLLRHQANVEKDPAKQQALIREAEKLHDRALDLRKKKVAGLTN